MKVSVVLPVFNGTRYLSEAIESVLAQDFTDWELLIINDFGSDDGSAEIARQYEAKDSRIKLIQNDERLGLAESLNLGIRIAQGEYVARLDADDIALPARFNKQVDFLDKNQHIGICGSWQHHFGTETWVHKPPISPELCRAYLLFFCHLCHSTLMFRKSIFVDNELYFDSNFHAEDFELWSRAVAVTDIANIPEVLGKYRHTASNITNTKRQKLGEESSRIIVDAAKRNLSIVLYDNDYALLNSWERVRKNKLPQLELLLRRIWQANESKMFYEPNALLEVLYAKWRHDKSGISWQEPVPIMPLDQIFTESYKGALIYNIKRFFKNNPTLIGKCKKIHGKLKAKLGGC